jgi:site-specific DNA-methyltransferase (adenine-specific)
MQTVKLDNNRITLICADCRDILPKIKPNCIDLVVADPPYYGVVKDTWDNQWATLQDHLEWSKQWIASAIATMKPSASFYVWGGVGERSDTIIHLKLLIDQLGLHFKDWITWKKDRGMGNRKGWVYAREECLWYVKDNKQFIWNDQYQCGDERRKRDQGLPLGQKRVSNNGHYIKSDFKRLTSVWSDISEQGNDVINKQTNHYTPKPLKAIDRIIRVHTLNNEAVILDPFLGSGTTGEVCAALGLRFIGIEKDEANFNEAVKFIETAIAQREAINAIK